MALNSLICADVLLRNCSLHFTSLSLEAEGLFPSLDLTELKYGPVMLYRLRILG